MKTKFPSITMFVLIILGFTANAEQKKSEIKKIDFLKLKKASMANGINSSQLKQLLISEEQLSVPGNSEDYSWDEDLSDWQHDSNTTYSYNNAGKLIEEIVQEPESNNYLTRDTYSYGSGNTFEEVSYIWNIDKWMPVNGEKRVNTFFEILLIGAVEQTLENGIWVNKSRIQYNYGNNNIPIGLQTYHWDGTEWVIYSKSLNLTWADWPNRELAAYTMQHLQEGNWVNAERFSKQFDGDNYTATTEIWDNEQWVNSTRETYSRTSTEEELILGNWTAQGWENTEKYQGTFDNNGNPTGMKYSSWYDTGWEVEMALFLDLTYNGSNDVTEMVISHWDPSLVTPVNLSKYKYSNFQHFTTDVPEISVLNNVKVFPNPVKNMFNISISDGNIKNYQVNITNLAGQTVYHDAFSNPSAVINTEKLIRGMYVLSIKTDDGKSHQTKILKQ